MGGGPAGYTARAVRNLGSAAALSKACVIESLEPCVQDFASLIPLVLLAVVFYLLVLRPARSRQRAVATLQAELAVGSAVMLSSGVYGQVVSIGEEYIVLRVAPEVVLTVNRHAVGRLLDDEALAALRSEGATSWELG